eukprot:1989664-Rhodomonas_salina.1
MLLAADAQYCTMSGAGVAQAPLYSRVRYPTLGADIAHCSSTWPWALSSWSPRCSLGQSAMRLSLGFRA